MDRSRPNHPPHYTDNDVEVRPDSSVHMTLSMSDLPYRPGPANPDPTPRPAGEQSLPPSSADPTTPQESFQCGTTLLSYGEPFRPIKSSVPCGVKPQVGEHPQARMSHVTSAAERDYDGPTMAHFRQHLSVIDWADTPNPPPQPTSSLPQTSLTHAAPNSVGASLPPPHENRALQDYQMQLMLLEQQRARVAQLRQEGTSQTCRSPPSPASSDDSLQDHPTPMTVTEELQRVHREQQQRIELQNARMEHQRAQIEQEHQRAHLALQSRPAERAQNSILQDYQIQMMYLEQQNKKRLMLSRQEQQGQQAQSAQNAGPQPDYQAQLMQLEQQNKQRLMQAREEQDRQRSRQVKEQQDQTK